MPPFQLNTVACPAHRYPLFSPFAPPAYLNITLGNAQILTEENIRCCCCSLSLSALPPFCAVGSGGDVISPFPSSNLPSLCFPPFFHCYPARLRFDKKPTRPPQKRTMEMIIPLSPPQHNSDSANHRV